MAARRRPRPTSPPARSSDGLRARAIHSRAVSALLALGLLLGTATAASAQVFLASRPHPFATVSHREVEQHEVAVEIEDDRVRDVEVRVGRSRAG